MVTSINPISFSTYACPLRWARRMPCRSRVQVVIILLIIVPVVGFDSIVVGLGEAVASLKDLLELFILLGAWLVVTANPMDQLH